MIKKNLIITFLIIVLGTTLISVNSGCKDEDSDNTIKDIDGNVYTSVTIGTQVWMVENLKVTKYNDGTPIPLVTDGTEWSKMSTPGYCWYENDETSYKNIYGAMYNWYAVNTGKLCPKGWHIPTDAEWKILSEYLGGENVAGGKLKEKGTTNWAEPNEGASDEVGFKALPCGGHYHNGNFGWMKNYGTFWSATENNESNAWTRYMRYDSKDLVRDQYDKRIGYSVRCIKD